MRTQGMLGVVLCMGFAFALLSGSGIGPAVFGENPGDEPTVDQLGDLSDESDLTDREDDSGGLGGVARGEDGLPGLILSGTESAVAFVASVALLPLTLMNLGFPGWFSIPAGGLAQIIAFFGALQFMTGREYL